MSNLFDFMKPRYKKIIIEAGFEDIIEFNDLNNETRFVGKKIRRSDREMIHQRLINEHEDTKILGEKIEKLKKLKKDLNEENFIKKKNILETIDYLTIIYSNLKEINEKLGEEYNSSLYLPGYTFCDSDAYLMIGNGNIYFVDCENYEILETINNDKISHIEIESEEEEVPAYIPKYKNAPSAPSAFFTNYSWNNQSTNKYMQNYYKNEYERKLAEYQSDLININIYNQNEQRKYEESLGKTRMVKHFYICFNDPEIEDIEFGAIWYSAIVQALPMLDIKDLDDGTTISGEKNDEDPIFKPVEKIKIGNEEVCYISVAQNLYIIHNIKDNVLELKLANGNHIVIRKYTNVDFKQMAKKLKSESIIGATGEKAFKKAELDDGATRFWGMLDNPNNPERSIMCVLVEYQNSVYEIKEIYEKNDDKYIDYDEEIDGKLKYDERFFGALNASISIIENINS